ncbi:DUF421 domain-containing protein [Rhodococcus sp. F64268]|uniref:DUF421 domain-containing protein n=1 Tax=Rhodococcus sp. F64268 TaxID=2926402 RepID=UPI001FF6B273|nr:YetF domain-containing protein [Rhodococcus sp. F64268]MCK0090192.1 DUF421 domain-containing protein [Rhodococcus sp. F64268]
MEIIVRAAVLFLFLWVVTRIVGRSTVGELSTFQLILYIAMGDLIQQGVTQQDYSVTAAVLTVGVFALLTMGLSWINSRFPRMRGITHGIPVIIVRDGVPDLHRLRTERMSLDDLMSSARQKGIRRFDEIELAVLETNGRVSFFTRAEGGADESAHPDII